MKTLQTRSASLLFSTCLVALFGAPKSAAGLGIREIVDQSKAEPPPQPFLTLLNRIGETPLVLKAAHRQKWSVRTRCARRSRTYCGYFVVCNGLRRSYMALLHDKAKKWRWLTTRLWAWSYATEDQAGLAATAIQAYWRVYNEKTVILRKGTLLVVAETDAPSTAAGQRSQKTHQALRKILGLPPASQKQAPQGPFSVASADRPKILNLSIPDKEMPKIMGRSTRLEDLRLLNRRGMKLYRKKENNRAAYIFELAAARSDTDNRYAVPIYNRACVAGLQKKVDEAIFWLWKLTQMKGGADYWRSCTADSLKRLRRANRDKDFREVKGLPAFRAFKKCMPPEGCEYRWTW